MTDTHTVLIAAGIFVGTTGVFFWLMGRLNEAGAQAFIGVLPAFDYRMTRPIRWIWLLQVWVSLWLGTVACPLAVGLAMLQVADSVSSSAAAAAISVFGFVLLVGSGGGFLLGIPAFAVNARQIRSGH